MESQPSLLQGLTTDSEPPEGPILPQGIIPAQVPCTDPPLPNSRGAAPGFRPKQPWQDWPLTSAPHGGTPGSRQGLTAGALRSGSRCLWLVALNQMLGVKRGESQNSAPPQYRIPPSTQSHSSQPAPTPHT